MKNTAVAMLAVVAGVSLSACSPTSQTIRDTEPPTSRPYGPLSYPQYDRQPYDRGMHDAHPMPTYSNRPRFMPSQQMARNEMPDLSPAELQAIGDQIFKNEGGGNVENLVHWNDGENFASMGIGHFTWYPAGTPARFGNTFPELLNYMQAKGVQLPGWLQQTGFAGAPWTTKSQLMQAKRSPQVQELQNLLYETRLLQAQYIVDRTRRAMPKLVESSPEPTRSRISGNLNAVANTPGGWYALIDYTNFKGEGLNRSGGYNGQNWGLLQVLEEMRPVQPGQGALHEFADAAMRVLERRVRNSPPANNEQRWLAGWANRVNTYRRLLV